MINKGKIIIIVCIPFILIFLISIASQFIALLYTYDQNREIQRNLIQQQITFSRQFSDFVSQSLMKEMQKFSIYLYSLNRLTTKTINSKVKFNEKHKLQLMNSELSYNNKEDPEVIQLLKRNYLLVNSWYHKNITKYEDLNLHGQYQLRNMSMVNVLWRAIQNENNKYQNNRRITVSGIFAGFEQDGMFYSTGYNASYNGTPPNPACGKGVFNYDLRCRPWYQGTKQQQAIKIFQPNYVITSAFPQIGSLTCQKTQIYNSEANEYQVYHVLCLDVKLSSLKSYYQYIPDSSQQLYLIEPLSQVALLYPNQSIQERKASTLNEIELKYLDNLKEAIRLNNTIKKNYGSYIYKTTNKIQLWENNHYQNQIIIPYERNDTQTTVILDPIYIYDKQEDKYFMDLAYLQIIIISDDKIKQNADQVETFFRKYFIFVNISLSIVGLISIFVIIRYACLIRNMLNQSIKHLTLILKQMIQKDISNEIFDITTDDFFQSKETKELFQSLKEIYQILLYTSENFFTENRSVTLLKLYKNIEFFKQFGNTEALGITFNNIGNILVSQEHYFEAIELFQTSIIYAKYQIQEFCKNHPDSQCANILSDFAFERNIGIQYQKLKEERAQSKHKALIKVNCSTNMLNSNSGKYYESNTSKILLNSFDTKLLLSQNRTILGRQNENSIHKRKTEISKYTDEDYHEELIELLSNYYFRTRNYILSIIEFQLSCESKPSYRREFYLWKEIKVLLIQQLAVLQLLPYSDYMQLEIYTVISRCYICLDKIEKAKLLLKDCENYLSTKKKELTIEQSNQQVNLNSNRIPNMNQDKNLYEGIIQEINRSIECANAEIKQYEDSFQDSSFKNIKQQFDKTSMSLNQNQSSNQAKDTMLASCFPHQSQQASPLITYQQEDKLKEKLIKLSKDKQISTKIKKKKLYKSRIQTIQLVSQKCFPKSSEEQDNNQVLEIEEFFSNLRKAEETMGSKQQLLTYYSPYFFCLRMEFQKASLFFLEKKYYQAAKILTKLLEKKRYFISNYNFRAFELLNIIFKINNTKSADLDEIRLRFNPDIMFQVGIIFGCNENKQQIVYTLQMLSNLVNDTLTYSKDQICIILVDQQDKYILEYLKLTKVQMIKPLIRMILNDIFQITFNKNINIFNNVVNLLKFHNNNAYGNDQIYNANELDMKLLNKEFKPIIKHNKSQEYTFINEKEEYKENEQSFNYQYSPTKQKLLQGNSHGSTFNKKLQIQDQIYKIQKSQGDLFGSLNLDDIVSVQNLDSNLSHCEINQNFIFHMSMRKILAQQFSCNLFPQRPEVQSKQKIFGQSDPVKMHEVMNQKFIIYTTMEIKIINNQLFQNLIITLFNLNIQLLIFSQEKGNNFLEQQPELTLVFKKKEIIKIFYTNQCLLTYLSSRRNKDIKNTLPYIIQHF